MKTNTRLFGWTMCIKLLENTEHLYRRQSQAGKVGGIWGQLRVTVSEKGDFLERKYVKRECQDLALCCLRKVLLQCQ